MPTSPAAVSSRATRNREIPISAAICTLDSPSMYNALLTSIIVRRSIVRRSPGREVDGGVRPVTGPSPGASYQFCPEPSPPPDCCSSASRDSCASWLRSASSSSRGSVDSPGDGDWLCSPPDSPSEGDSLSPPDSPSEGDSLSPPDSPSEGDSLSPPDSPSDGDSLSSSPSSPPPPCCSCSCFSCCSLDSSWLCCWRSSACSACSPPLPPASPQSASIVCACS